jgi:hypothetical protein
LSQPSKHKAEGYLRKCIIRLILMVTFGSRKG